MWRPPHHSYRPCCATSFLKPDSWAKSSGGLQTEGPRVCNLPDVVRQQSSLLTRLPLQGWNWLPHFKTSLNGFAYDARDWPVKIWWRLSMLHLYSVVTMVGVGTHTLDRLPVHYTLFTPVHRVRKDCEEALENVCASMWTLKHKLDLKILDLVFVVKKNIGRPSSEFDPNPTQSTH